MFYAAIWTLYGALAAWAIYSDYYVNAPTPPALVERYNDL
jgi:hypothetical protein